MLHHIAPRSPHLNMLPFWSQSTTGLPWLYAWMGKDLHDIFSRLWQKDVNKQGQDIAGQGTLASHTQLRRIAILSPVRTMSLQGEVPSTYMGESFLSFIALSPSLVKLEKYPYFPHFLWKMWLFFNSLSHRAGSLSLLHLDNSKIKLTKHSFHNALRRNIRKVRFKLRWKMTAKP